MVEVTCQVHEALGVVIPADRRAWALQRVAWSNLFKLGESGGGPPSNALAKAQWDETKRLLQLELTNWRPTAVLCVVGDSFADDVREAFGADDWEREPVPALGKDLWAKSFGPDGCRVYWMRHPQGARVEVLDAIRAYIAADQAERIA